MRESTRAWKLNTKKHLGSTKTCTDFLSELSEVVLQSRVYTTDVLYFVGKRCNILPYCSISLSPSLECFKISLYFSRELHTFKRCGNMKDRRLQYNCILVYMQRLNSRILCSVAVQIHFIKIVYVRVVS